MKQGNNIYSSSRDCICASSKRVRIGVFADTVAGSSLTVGVFFSWRKTTSIILLALLLLFILYFD